MISNLLPVIDTTLTGTFDFVFGRERDFTRLVLEDAKKNKLRDCYLRSE